MTKEEKKKYDRERYLRNRDYFLQYGREKYKKHRKKILLKHRDYRVEKRKEVVDYLGGECIVCKFSDERALQIDHVEGKGRKDRNRQTVGFYKRVMEDKSGKYQLLCANCNCIKRIKNKEHKEDTIIYE